MQNEQQTIAAIATATGEGGISIVRLSGPEAFDVADRIFRSSGPPPSARPPNTFVYGHIVEEDGTTVDEVLLLIMREPSSYTREDMVEIQGHGGRVSAQRILRACLQAGAQLAEPGEFTRRAFINGRLDLVQAEAVLDIIHAASDRAARAAQEQLKGQLSRSMNKIHDLIMEEHAKIEALLDFTEEHIIALETHGLNDSITLIIKEIDILLESYREGHLLREGAAIVLIGRPNTGKSTLMNQLLGKERAIVSENPGTTRDSIEEEILLHGIPVRLIDTAGLRDTTCSIEQKGIQQTRTRINEADLFIFLLDASVPMDEALAEELQQFPEEKTLFLVNKKDIQQFDHLSHIDKPWKKAVSLKTSGDVDQIIPVIRHMLDSHAHEGTGQEAVISERHEQKLKKARHELVRVRELCQQDCEQHLPFIASHFQTALDALGQITGRNYHDELLDHIFSHFCIGK